MLEMPAQGMRRFWEQGAIALVLVLALAIVPCQADFPTAMAWAGLYSVLGA